MSGPWTMRWNGPRSSGRYNQRVRRKSFINEQKRLDAIERARRMTPEQRMEAAANLSQTVKEIERAGKQQREGKSKKERS